MFKKLSVIALAFTMLFTAIPASAATSKEYFYLTSKTLSSPLEYTMYVELGSSQKVTASSVKSSDTSIASRYYLTYSNNDFSTTDYEDSSNNYADSSRYAWIGLKVKKAGTTTISYKIGSTTYKKKLVVKSYTNPVKSITLTNVNSSKTFASKTASSASAKATLKKTTANAKLKVTAKSGWKIQSVQVFYNKYSSSSNTSTSTSYYRSYSTPKSSVSPTVGRLTKGRSYTLAVTFVNTTNGGTITTEYAIS